MREAVHGDDVAGGAATARAGDPGCGLQCDSIPCTMRIAEAGTEPSMGSRGESCDSAPAEATISL